MRSLATIALSLVSASGCTLRGTAQLQHEAGCVAPLADCDGDGSCETDLAGDASHCGACGYACNGIACHAGSCLVDELDGMIAWQIDIDDAHAYLTCQPPRIVFVPLHGGGWDNFDVAPTQNLFGIHVDEQSVWWAAQTFDTDQWYPVLLRKARGAASSAAEEKWRGQAGATLLAGSVTGSGVTIAWSFGHDPSSSEVHGALKSELPASRIIATGEPFVAGLATNPQFDVLWVHGGGELTRWPPDATFDLAGGLVRPFDVVLTDPEEAYYVELGPAETPPAPNGQLGRVRWQNPPEQPVAPEVLLTDLAEPLALLADHTHVYLSESSLESDVRGAVKRIDRATSAVETLARTPEAVVGDLDMHGDTLAWVVVHTGAATVTEVWKRSKNAYALPP